MTRKVDPADVNYSVEQLRVDYIERGLAEYAIAHQQGVTREIVRRWLREAGVERRSPSEAGRIRASKMSPEERAAQAAAAHSASRGRATGWYERCRSARGRELRPPAMSVHEQAFADAVEVPFRREVAVGPYNVDFTIGPIAVEILGGEWHADKVVRHGERTPYVLSEAWHVAFVWAVANYPLTPAAAKYVVAWANETSRDPASLGEYRVIRGDGHLITAGRCDDGEFPGIPPARGN